MPAKRDTIERLNLTFRAEAAPVPRSGIPGGLLLCCLIGVGVGIACWFVGRQQLASSLSTRLTRSTSPAEAMLAVEGLMMLDADSSLEIVRGLENVRLEVAETAYRKLDKQIILWQSLEPPVGLARMSSLAKRLEQLSDSTPVDNLVLARSLASRIFSICLERDDPQLRPLMRTCEAVFQRVGSARSRLEADIEQLESNLATALPPPPVGMPQPAINETQFTKPANGMAEFEPPGAAQVDQSHTAPLDANLTSSSSTPTATMYMTIGQTRQRSQTRAVEETPQAELPSDRFKLNEERAIEIERDSAPKGAAAGEGLPVVVATPASLSITPIIQMKVASSQVDLDGIQNLEIEELVRLLASAQPRVAQAAALALRAKGMDDTKLTLASELARGSVAQRLELVQQIANDGTIEPRPWLLWMAEDGEPEVRKLSVSLLSSMLDANVERGLRNLLARERDPQVERAIRETLLVRNAKR